MSTTHARTASIGVALWLVAALIACGGNKPSSSSASNWLHCESDADCVDEFPGSTCSSEGLCVDREGEPLPGAESSDSSTSRRDGGDVITSEGSPPDAGGASDPLDTGIEDATDLVPELDASPSPERDASPTPDPDAGPGPEPNPSPNPSDPSEDCELPMAEWIPMASQPELNSLTRSVAWYDGALHYVGDGLTRTDVNSATFEYGKFDPCSNTWERATFPITADVRHLIGWDGSGFLFGPNNFAFTMLSTRGLRVMTRLGLRYAVDDAALLPVMGPLGGVDFLAYPEEIEPEPLPVTPSYMNGATDGARAFVWGQPVPTEDEPNPAPRGWMLDAGSRVWREITQQGAPSVRRNHYVIAAGDRFLVWSGTATDNTSERFGDGAFYDPDTDSWEAIPSEGAPGGGNSAAFFWVADRFVVNPGGSGAVYRAGEGWRALEPLGGSIVNPRRLVTDDGRILLVVGSTIHVLDVATATWLDVATPTAEPSVENQPDFFDVVWTGSSLLFWGSSVPQTCEVSPELPVCDIIDPYLPAGEGAMLRLE